MNALDVAVIAIYLIAMLGIGFFVRDQKGEGDYFLGGRSMGWAPLALSTMATQLSAISFISAPAFVGLREGGGLRWLTYELALPLAMIVVVFVIAPALYRANAVSIYDYLEKRLGKSTRILISLSFQVVRSFSTGIMIYAPALILQSVLGIPLWQSIFAVGVIALIYSVVGGMRAVVYSDAAQMILIVVGLLAIGVIAFFEIGGFSGLERVEPSRWTAVDVSSLGLSGDSFGLLPMLFGGFVLYASYYGCDQTQAQRILSSRDMGSVRRMLAANGFLRFPVVLLYCMVGLILGVAVTSDPNLAAQIPANQPDYLMPIYIRERLPNGIIGLLIVAILSAAMSSVSSAMNSLAAVTLADLKAFGVRMGGADGEVRLARYLSLGWGVIMIALSFLAGDIAPTVIEAINKVGSALYGPVLGVFALAIARRSWPAIAANAGLIAGVAVNVALWRFAPQVFWMWWNLIGLVVTLVVAVAVGAVTSRPDARVAGDDVAIPGEDALPRHRRLALSLGGYFLLILSLTFAFGSARACLY